MQKQYLSPPALARHLGVAERTVYRWIDSGLIPSPSVSIGDTGGFDSEAVQHIEKWYNERTQSHHNTEELHP